MCLVLVNTGASSISRSGDVLPRALDLLFLAGLQALDLRNSSTSMLNSISRARARASPGRHRHQLRMRKKRSSMYSLMMFDSYRMRSPLHQHRQRLYGFHHRDVLGLVCTGDVDDLDSHALFRRARAAAVLKG